jgi:hypothetical protein
MLDGTRAIDGLALYSGNFSVPRALFAEVEGFNTELKACEDTDLGIRLQKTGAAFNLNLGAVGWHSGYHNYSAWKGIAYKDGRWDAEEALKLAYPFGWRELLEQHHARVREQLVLHRGIELDTSGDGFFARFDGPARAIRCACAVREHVRELGLDVRAGLHTGECELLEGKVAGIAVSIGARVAARAGPGEVLVSQTVRDLVAGSGIAFQERGVAELKGVPGEWRLYAVETS